MPTKTSKYLEKETSYLVEIYDYTIHVVVSNNIIKARNKRKKRLNGKYEDKEQPGGLFSTIQNYEGFIFLKWNTDVEVIVHEVFHAVCDIMRKIGTNLSSKSEECYAYPIGVISQKIYNFVELVKDDFKENNNDKTKSERPAEVADKV